jgi:hypothetical protein
LIRKSAETAWPGSISRTYSAYYCTTDKNELKPFHNRKFGMRNVTMNGMKKTGSIKADEWLPGDGRAPQLI